MRVHLHGAARAFPTGVKRTEHCCAEQQCVRTEASHVKGDLFWTEQNVRGKKEDKTFTRWKKEQKEHNLEELGKTEKRR